jgi:hypothetical protein
LSGPREYSVGTERALFILAQGTCYYPGCRIPAVVFVEGIPATNVQMAHIRGANLGSPRYDPGMNDGERASFDNLILLCKPHHDLVDRINPGDFSAQTLQQWKADREGPGVEALRGLQGITERRLEEMLEAAIRAAGLGRTVTVELAGGVLLGSHLASGPLDGWRTLLDLNPHLTGERVVVATVRNTGGLLASVESISIYFLLGPGGTHGQLAMAGNNDVPLFNPSLPVRLDAGESTTWLTSLETFRLVLSRVSQSQVEITEFRAEAVLGSGEKISSGLHEIALLPLEA